MIERRACPIIDNSHMNTIKVIRHKPTLRDKLYDPISIDTSPPIPAINARAAISKHVLIRNQNDAIIGLTIAWHDVIGHAKSVNYQDKKIEAEAPK